MDVFGLNTLPPCAAARAASILHSHRKKKYTSVLPPDGSPGMRTKAPDAPYPSMEDGKAHISIPGKCASDGFVNAVICRQTPPRKTQWRGACPGHRFRTSPQGCFSW